MTSMLIELGEELQLTHDLEERYIVSEVSWEEYEALCSQLGDSLRYRVAYLEGTLEIMSPSRRHEFAKKNIALLLEGYFQETKTRFWGLGSTTFRKPEQKAGKEPDECYCIGTDKEIPDLAIEVVLTSGGVDKLAVYQRLGVKEVWFWHNERFEVHHLEGEEYEQVSRSQLLPHLNLDLLANYVLHPDPLKAVLEFRQQVEMG